MESLGAITPLLTTTSRAERATLRAAREMVRRQAELGIAPAPNDGTAATRRDIERLTGSHRADYAKLDWSEQASREPLPLPTRTHTLEKAARRALAAWQPSWQERMFGDEAQKRRQLAAKVYEAAREDEIAFQKAYRAAEAHNSEALTARKLFELDLKAIKEAVGLKSRLAELREAMNSVAVALPGGGRVVAVVEAVADADIPYERLADGDPGTARREKISAADRRQIHLAAICSAGLRAGAEMVSVLPVEAVEVVVCCELPEPGGGGRPASKPVLQLMMTARALRELNWKTADAVTLATSLGARMDWSVEKGFAPIRLVALSAMGRPLAATA